MKDENKKIQDQQDSELSNQPAEPESEKPVPEKPETETAESESEDIKPIESENAAEPASSENPSAAEPAEADLISEEIDEISETDQETTQEEAEVIEKEETEVRELGEKQVSKNEIDEFTQKLLNRKTEMALWPEDEKQEEQTEMSPEERKAAEASLSDALDLLRKQRGQVPIEQEEEEDAAWEHIEFHDRFEGGDNFTTQSLFMNDQPEKSIQKTGKYENQAKARENYIEQTEKRPVTKSSSAISNASKRLSRTLSGSSKQDTRKKTSSKKRRKKRKLRRQAVLLIAGLVGLILILFAGYYYKTAVYDPANSVTAEQQASYDKLLAYAEEYSMNSDAEKLELLNMENDYNQLSEKQKDQINERFIANTGKSFPDLLAELKTKDGSVTSEDDPVYQSLLSYAEGYGSLDDDQKMQITEHQAEFDSLSSALKDKINQAMQSQVGMSFTDALDAVQNGEVPSSAPAQDDSAADNSDQSNGSGQDTDQNQSSPAVPSANEAPVQNSQPAVDNSAQIAEYQAMIDQTVALRDDYLASLAEDGLSSQGDEVVAQYNQEIAYWQGLISALQ